jgi:hypothetical protein
MSLATIGMNKDGSTDSTVERKADFEKNYTIMSFAAKLRLFLACLQLDIQYSI